MPRGMPTILEPGSRSPFLSLDAAHELAPWSRAFRRVRARDSGASVPFHRPADEARCAQRTECVHDCQWHVGSRSPNDAGQHVLPDADALSGHRPDVLRLLGVRPDPVGCALLAGARLDRPSAWNECQGPEEARALVVVRSSALATSELDDRFCHTGRGGAPGPVGEFRKPTRRVSRRRYCRCAQMLRSRRLPVGLFRALRPAYIEAVPAPRTDLGGASNSRLR
jgi:hypothetical protein